MPRRLLLPSVLFITACDSHPRFDPDGPGASRFAVGIEAVVRTDGDIVPGALSHGHSSLRGANGLSVFPEVRVESGTRVRIVADDDPSRVEYLTAPDVNRTKVERRIVRVEIMEGPHEGVVGYLTRNHLRSANTSQTNHQ